MRAKHVAAVSAMMLANEEGEVGVAALAPEHGFVLNPARPAVILDCIESVKMIVQMIEVLQLNIAIRTMEPKSSTANLALTTVGMGAYTQEICLESALKRERWSVVTLMNILFSTACSSLICGDR